MRSYLVDLLACTTLCSGLYAESAAPLISAKYRESIHTFGTAHPEHELKLTYKRPVGQHLEAIGSWRGTDNAHFKHELEGGVGLHNSWHPGIGIMHQQPSGNNYLELFADRQVHKLANAHLSIEGLYNMNTHPGWAKLKMKAEVPLATTHGWTVLADIKHYRALSPHERNKTSFGVSIKTGVQARKLYRLLR